ncbi:MAG: hypothetical protein K2N08_00325 [Muribaculaceae bacterium]|nr:hypothetical protein [Muribaculaceae bacterium]
MKYKIPFSTNSPIDPIAYKYLDRVPQTIREHGALMDCLLHLAPRLYINNPIENVDPYYKIVELLQYPKLTYDTLLTIKRYYKIDLIRYLIENNLAEYYIGYPCYSASDLRKALSEKRNQTDGSTLGQILANMI